MKHLRLKWFIEVLTKNRPNLSKPRTEEAVDEEVGGRVDDQEDVGDEAEEDDPDGEATKNGAVTELDLLQDRELVEVEGNPEQMAEDEGEDDHHEDDGHVVVLLSPHGPPPYGLVDPE